MTDSNSGYRPSRKGLKTAVFYVPEDIKEVIDKVSKGSNLEFYSQAVADLIVKRASPEDIMSSIKNGTPSTSLAAIIARMPHHVDIPKEESKDTNTSEKNPTDGIRDSNPRPDEDPDPELNK